MSNQSGLDLVQKGYILDEEPSDTYVRKVFHLFGSMVVLPPRP
jgi:hypothetical protein